MATISATPPIESPSLRNGLDELDHALLIEGLSYPSGVVELVSFVGALLARYYGMLLASAVVQRRMILNPKGMEHMTQPYRGVIKMHLMIFVFAGLHFLGATNFWFYAATLFAYFFPTSRGSSRSMSHRSRSWIDASKSPKTAAPSRGGRRAAWSCSTGAATP